MCGSPGKPDGKARRSLPRGSRLRSAAPPYFLTLFDREADFTVEQALPALANPDLPTTDVAEFVFALDRDRPLYRHRRLSLNKTTVMDRSGLTTGIRPQRNYRSPRTIRYALNLRSSRPVPCFQTVSELVARSSPNLAYAAPPVITHEKNKNYTFC